MARLKNAGAVLLGKGNMGEWAFSPTFSLSSIAGAVRNPYDLDRTPAGSSGGPAAGGTSHPYPLTTVSHCGKDLQIIAIHPACATRQCQIGLT